MTLARRRAIRATTVREWATGATDHGDADCARQCRAATSREKCSRRSAIVFTMLRRRSCGSPSGPLPDGRGSDRGPDIDWGSHTALLAPVLRAYHWRRAEQFAQLVDGDVDAVLHGAHEQARLDASDASVDDELGYSVALRGDLALVGARSADVAPGAVDAGAAYVFVRSGTVWTE